MTRTEFLEELRDSLQGEVPAGVIQENVVYYDNYISQERTKGRTEDEIIGELGGPRIIAKTIIDSNEAAQESGGYGGYHTEQGSGQGSPSSGTSYNQNPGNGGSWYRKFIVIAVLLLIIIFVFSLVGGIFSLLFRYAGPLIFIWLAYSLFKNMKR